MSIIVDKEHHYSTVRKTCYAANILYLILHVLYLVLFVVSKFNILVYIDAAIIAIYLLFFILLSKKKYYLYVLCCGNLFFAFIAVTTIMLGFDTGFHFYLIGLCVISFFTSYFSKSRSIKSSLIWVGLSLAIYLTLYFVTQFNTPYYAIEKWLELTLFTAHVVVVFALIAIYLVIFLTYAFSLEKKIMNESRTDELTKINNRYALYDYFNQNENKSSLVLALFDIDDFKNINDTYGHPVGDQILKRVADITIESLKDSFVCRYGGEEFIIVLQNNDGSAFDTLEDFRKAIEKEVFTTEDVKIDITITIGASKFTNGMTLEKWVELADKKMYYGKNNGKNQTVI